MEPQRRWSIAGLACAAMLVLPALTWLLTPRREIFALPAPSVAFVASTFQLEPASPRRAGIVRAPSTTESAPPVEAGPVTGLVLDPDGRPAPKAFVGCDDRDQTLATATDDEGRFTLPAEAAGCLAIAHHPDFVGSARVPLVTGRSNTLRLDRGGGIEGDVVDERGVPVASYLLAVESYQGSSTALAPTGQLKEIQDPRGVFAWENIVPGRYVLTASGGGRPPARSRPVDVDVGRATAHVRITLARGATLTGRVLDAATRKPVAGVLLALDAFTSTRANSVRPVRSDDQGAYTLEGAPAGPFSVRFMHEGYRTRTVTGLTTRGAPTIQQDVELNPIADGGTTGEDFAGIGAFLASSQGGVTFTRLVPEGPAEQAGIHPGDLIRRIDGADTSSLALVECMQSLRGPDGSRVSVQVERAGLRVDVTIQRRALTL